MVAHDELGGLLPIKRTIRVIDAQNQHFREQEVSGRGCRGGKRGVVYLFIYLFEGRVGSGSPLSFPLSVSEGRRRVEHRAG